jgi:hypothetical protein
MITDLSTTALLVCNSIDHDFPLSSDERRKKKKFCARETFNRWTEERDDGCGTFTQRLKSNSIET